MALSEMAEKAFAGLAATLDHDADADVSLQQTQQTEMVFFFQHSSSS
jgi:hypothetical protein